MSWRWLDPVVIAFYVTGLTALGLWFSRRQTSTETYFVAKRSVPAWAMGISLLGTLITSVTFIAYPRAAYGNDWSLLVPGFMAIVVFALVGLVVVPFYRHAVGMSAYEFIGNRFGRPARTYASITFVVGHFSKMAFVFYLLGLTVNSITGWNTDRVILISGLLTIAYTLKGGFEAVIWTDVIQGLLLWAGIFISLGYLLFLMPGWPSSLVNLAASHGKFGLGEASFALSRPSLLVLLIYGFFWYLQKYIADQTIVQRYLVARSDREAIKGVALGAFLCVPVWSLFMLIGTCTWTLFRLNGEKLPSYITKADQVFPYFLSTHVPPGLAGLFLAALLGAAMCSLGSDLNSFALVGVEDVYRLARPGSTDAERLRVGKVLVGACGLICVFAAVALTHTKGSALSMWYTVSAIASGGLAGLFLLAFFSRRATRRGVYIGMAASLLFTIWAALTLPGKRLLNLTPFNFPWHEYTVGAISHIVLLVIGYIASLLLQSKNATQRPMTIWRWLAIRHNIGGQQAITAADNR